MDAFLPRIRSVFYATFDAREGPKLVYQVPEGSINTSTPSFQSPRLASTSVEIIGNPDLMSLSALNLNGQSPSRPPLTSRPSPSNKRSNTSSTAALLNFDSIVEYVIPKNHLCGRLVRCNTPTHRFIGFPVVLTGEKYERNEFRYNLCFVFDRLADLSCYEPIVRKCARVLLSCEQESGFLSSPETSKSMYPVLEQLYEDLNSYSETSIPIDSFNSIELRIFPFYPNPAKVYEWQVPVSLLNLEKRRDPSWDLTMVNVIPHINGVNHVLRIAELADATAELTCQCIAHLLFYQCVMMIDIFQFSNMYTLKSNMQWLAEDPSVQDECAPYVTIPGQPLPPFTTLLHLYSRLKPGKTVYIWMEENNVAELGIDPRRFVSFGVIKGFLRRVHRWPFLLSSPSPSRAAKNGKTPAHTQEVIIDESEVKTPTATSVGEQPTMMTTPITITTSNPTTPSPTPQRIPLRRSSTFVPHTPLNPQFPISKKEVKSPRLPKELEGLPALLDGSKHTDELCVILGIGWSELERALIIVGSGGGGKKELTAGDDPAADKMGLVRILYR